MSPETLAVAALITACTYLIFGLTGFGSTVLALPLLAHLVPLKFAVPMLLLLDFLAGILLISRVRRGVRVDELGRLFPFMLAGIVLGLTLLIRLPEAPLLAVLGLFLVAYAGYGMTRRAGPPRLSRAWSAPIGLAAGVLGALFGTGGVLTALYIGARLDDKEELRATAAAAVLLNTSLRIVLYGATGLLTQDGLLTSALVLLPSVLVGLFLGNRLHASVPTGLVVRLIYAVVAIAGASLLLRVFALV
ncbi:MAG: sulfite exporter TauE/SafE family protein [Betaproteobacteria bacterium]|nr:sulfite exporter TauE/SafE family protein [Betaproteobacteria bacterium]